MAMLYLDARIFQVLAQQKGTGMRWTRVIMIAIFMIAQSEFVQAQSGGELGTLSAQSINDLAAKLDRTLKQLEQTQAQVQSLTSEVKELRNQVEKQGLKAATVANCPTKSNVTKVEESLGSKTNEQSGAATSAETEQTAEEAFRERVIDPALGGDERSNKITPRPELFVQARYSTLPDNHATINDFSSNFRVSRVEARWAGRLNEHFGAGFEIQYHPAPDGDPTQLVNDAFVQYYPTEHVTLTGGQFVLPFGFDNQQSSSDRESPERAMFVGYFFPGHRDRGALLQGDIQSWNYFAGVFNGNHFYADNNRQLNYDFRLRKRFDSNHLAVGVSGQVGHQILPPGMVGTDAQNVIGADAQYVVGRLGIRGEVLAGNMPSTLLSITPQFAASFRPGRHSSAITATLTYALTAKDNLYARYDQFDGDPVTDLDIRAANFGYFHTIGEHVRVGFDYQLKNHLSFNDDAVNTRFQLSWQAVF